MPRKAPSLCQRKDGRFYLTDPASKKPIYFGHDRAEAERRYGRWLMEFYARNPSTPGPPGIRDITVSQLADAYLEHADTYYRKHGKPTSEVNTVEQVVKFLVSLHGRTVANDFRPLALKSVRQAMIDAGLSRKHINRQVSRIRRIWRWGVEQEFVKPDTLAALEAVAPLAKGRSAAAERPPIKPVAWGIVEATLPFLRYDYLRVMVQVHRLSACRSQDVVCMRPCDLDRSGPVWVYRPAHHKTEHLERDRVVYLGPKCQALLAPLLRRTSPKGWLFPSMGCGRHKGRGPGHLTVNGYRQVIESAVKRANLRRAKEGKSALSHWFPLAIRHTALTEIRSRHGLDAAQVMGGHANAKTTEIYAERDAELARKIAALDG
jgi:integrase